VDRPKRGDTWVRGARALLASPQRQFCGAKRHHALSKKTVGVRLKLEKYA